MSQRLKSTWGQRPRAISSRAVCLLGYGRSHDPKAWKWNLQPSSMGGLVSYTCKNSLFKPPWVKAVIARRAWAGLGQLLEWEERPSCRKTVAISSKNGDIANPGQKFLSFCLQIKTYNKLDLFCMFWVFAWNKCVFIMCGAQKGALDPLKLELGVFMNDCVGAGHWAWVFWKSSQCQLLSQLSLPQITASSFSGR